MRPTDHDALTPSTTPFRSLKSGGIKARPASKQGTPQRPCEASAVFEARCAAPNAADAATPGMHLFCAVCAAARSSIGLQRWQWASGIGRGFPSDGAPAGLPRFATIMQHSLGFAACGNTVTVCSVCPPRNTAKLERIGTALRRSAHALVSFDDLVYPSWACGNTSEMDCKQAPFTLKTARPVQRLRAWTCWLRGAQLMWMPGSSPPNPTG